MLDNIYFDNAATTRIDPLVLDAMMPWLKEGYGNPSSAHNAGRSARLAIVTARKKIASILNCNPNSIIFTAGGTESANTVIRGSITRLGVKNILSSATEHKCVLETIKSVCALSGPSSESVPLDDRLIPSYDLLMHLLDQKRAATLVAMMHANNETGAMLDIESVGQLARDKKAFFFSDTVCTMGHVPIDLTRIPVDMCSASAHKFHGPKGVGFLYIREGIQLPALITGGAHENGLRAGTENVASIVGMAAALELAVKKQEEDREHITALRKRMKEILLSLGATINLPSQARGLYTILSAGFERNQKTEMLLQQLDMAGVAVSGGSACSAGSAGSHVMEAIGAGERVNIRFSFSRFNTMDEVERTGKLLEKFVNTKQTVM